MNIARIRKAVAAVAASLAALVAAGVLTGTALDIVNIAIAVIGAAAIGLAVYATPNAPQEPAPQP